MSAWRSPGIKTTPRATQRWDCSRAPQEPSGPISRSLETLRGELIGFPDQSYSLPGCHVASLPFVCASRGRQSLYTDVEPTSRGPCAFKGLRHWLKHLSVCLDKRTIACKPPAAGGRCEDHLADLVEAETSMGSAVSWKACVFVLETRCRGLPGSSRWGPAPWRGRNGKAGTAPCVPESGCP